MQLILTRPDDCHLHLRDGAALADVVGHTAARFARAIVMPNLKPPVVTTDAAVAYRQRIADALPPGMRFEPLMTLYLTDSTRPAEIAAARASGVVAGVKYYPAGATTNSESGVTAIENAYPALEAMEELDLPLLVHGEVTDPGVDVFDREARFIDRVLEPLADRYPGLRVVLEHVTTAEGLDFVRAGRQQLAATITAHHLLLNRNAMFDGGMRPHHYCLPVLKREAHRRALLEAAVSGSPQFFLGTDSAPHAVGAKETACGCAGIYTAHAAIELYAEAFEQVGALHRLEPFASHFGADFYGWTRNAESIRLEKEAWDVPTAYPFAAERLTPLRAGARCHWRIVP